MQKQKAIIICNPVQAAKAQTDIGKCVLAVREKSMRQEEAVMPVQEPVFTRHEMPGAC